jgi:predicted dehydrogenase
MNLSTSRRSFLKASATALSASALPLILPPDLLGASAPSKLINIGIIGCGRISSSFEVPSIIGQCSDLARIVAICDLDSRRLQYAKDRIQRDYDKKLKTRDYSVKTFSKYRDMIADPSIDAVMVCVPDHWHALCAAEVLLSGKHLWLQKPFSQTILEGRIIANLAKTKGLVVQVGSQQRSWSQFHDCCELVRNGRIGAVKKIEVGIGLDKSGGSSQEMPVPPTFDYDTWLGPTPPAFYTETRVHTQDLKHVTDRPGWIQMAPYGWGMITNWGAHHLDIVQWGLGTEDSGPAAVSGTCQWMDTTGGKLWNVHTTYDLHFTYPGGVDVHVCDKYQNGVKFIGDKGAWLFCTRGPVKVTASDPVVEKKPGQLTAFEASDPKLLAKIDNPSVPLMVSHNHFRNWLQAVIANNPKATVTSAEHGFRSSSVCMLGEMCMKTGKTLAWDPKAEKTGDPDADKLMQPFARGDFSLDVTLKRHGLSVADVLRS